MDYLKQQIHKNHLYVASKMTDAKQRKLYYSLVNCFTGAVFTQNLSASSLKDARTIIDVTYGVLEPNYSEGCFDRSKEVLKLAHSTVVDVFDSEIKKQGLEL